MASGTFQPEMFTLGRKPRLFWPRSRPHAGKRFRGQGARARPAAAAALEASVLPEVAGSACRGRVLRHRGAQGGGDGGGGAAAAAGGGGRAGRPREAVPLGSETRLAGAADRQADGLGAGAEGGGGEPAGARRGEARAWAAAARPPRAGVRPALLSHRGGSGGSGLRVPDGRLTLRPPRLALPCRLAWTSTRGHRLPPCGVGRLA